MREATGCGWDEWCDQQPDGTFTISTSRTITTDAAALREMLIDDAERVHLFPGHETVLRSRPTAKMLRIGIAPGVVQFAVDPRTDGRTTWTVTHVRLPAPDDVDDVEKLLVSLAGRIVGSRRNETCTVHRGGPDE